MLYLLFVFSYVSWCPAQFPYRTMFISCKSNTTDGTSAAGTAYTFGTPELTPMFCEVRVAKSLGFDFVDHCNCFMYLFINQLHCLFFFDLQDTLRGQDICR
jgi:hypothetical protein